MQTTLERVLLSTKREIAIEATMATTLAVVSLLPFGAAISSLVLAFGTIGFISRLGLAAIFINIIVGGLSGHFFILIAIFRLCQICGAEISDKIDSAVRVWSKKFAGFVLGLFIASTVEGAVAAGIWECGGLDFFEGVGKICIAEIVATVGAFIAVIVSSIFIAYEVMLQRLKNRNAMAPIHTNTSLMQPILKSQDD